jgi:hypothetical protein
MQLLKVLALAAALIASQPAMASDSELRASVKTLAAALTDGYATLSPTDISIVHASEPEHVAVFFFLVGFGKGNGSSQYIAFFEPNEPFPGERISGPPYRLVALSQIGAKYWRYLDPKTAQFHKRSVVVSGRTYAPKDALCCPTKPFNVVFSISNGRIIERVGDG